MTHNKSLKQVFFSTYDSRYRSLYDIYLKLMYLSYLIIPALLLLSHISIVEAINITSFIMTYIVMVLRLMFKILRMYKSEGNTLNRQLKSISDAGFLSWIVNYPFQPKNITNFRLQLIIAIMTSFFSSCYLPMPYLLLTILSSCVLSSIIIFDFMIWIEIWIKS